MKEIRLYSTLERKKVTFSPIDPSEITFYACGVTVYDFCHIGHARAYVAFDCMRRIFEHVGYKVNYVQNFTDIDDKIIARAQENNEDYHTLTERFITAYHEDMAALGIKPASRYPKATEHITAIQDLIQTLLNEGAAYINGNDVCFEVEKAKDYGKLSKKVLEELEAGARIEIGSGKKNPLDFVLWKGSKPGEPAWDSPWGSGRPGWHIECSAMVEDTFGGEIDIHAGGEDLVFPHHENEIAQSECGYHHPLAKYWVHNGFVTIKDAKMSKSKKNFVTLRDLLQDYDGEVIRFFLCKTHYRHPLQFSTERIQEAQYAYRRLQNTVFSDLPDDPNPEDQPFFETLKQRYLSALTDDFNVAEAIGILFELNKRINQSGAGKNILKTCGQIVGFFKHPPHQKNISNEVQTLIDERWEAKLQKDFQKADQIRTTLKEAHGIIIKDTATGSVIV